MKRNYLTPAREQWLERHPELSPTGSMLRRCAWHDYCSPCIYMLTLVVQDRKPLLGELCSPDDNHSIAWIKKSPLGMEVKRAWNNIPNHYPQIKLLSLCIMPDHIHGILQVKERLPRHLGHVVNGFKKGCNDAMRSGAVNGSMMGGVVNGSGNAGSNDAMMGGVVKGGSNDGMMGGVVNGGNGGCNDAMMGGVQYSEAVPRTTQLPPCPAPGTHLWQQGYHDRILSHEGQLATLFRYLDDNPRRLWLKRHRPEYFSIIKGIDIAGAHYNAMGNIDILAKPFKCAVQCSRGCVKMRNQVEVGTTLPCRPHARNERKILHNYLNISVLRTLRTIQEYRPYMLLFLHYLAKTYFDTPSAIATALG